MGQTVVPTNNATAVNKCHICLQRNSQKSIERKLCLDGQSKGKGTLMELSMELIQADVY